MIPNNGCMKVKSTKFHAAEKHMSIDIKGLFLLVQGS